MKSERKRIVCCKSLLYQCINTLVFICILFLLLPQAVYSARSLSIESDRNSLLGDEEMLITASASGFVEGEKIYVKGAFYQESSTSNYFGYTKNGESWIKNSQTSTDQLSVILGTWDGKVRVKSDFNDSGYKGEGGYKFKLGFYYINSSGKVSSVNWSDNILDVDIYEPDPTPTQEPTNPPTTAPTQTAPATSTPKPTPTKTPTPKPTPTPTQSGRADESENLVVDTNIEIVESIPEGLVAGATDTKNPPVVAVIFVLLGISCLGYVGYMIYNQRHAQEDQHN